MVTWQSSQRLVLAMWPAGFPVAVTPSWQLAQVPVTAVWSTETVNQSVLTWQSSQTVPLAMWVER